MSLRGTGGQLTPQHQVGGTPLVSPKVNTKGQQLAQALGVAFKTASTTGVDLLNDMNQEAIQEARERGLLGEDFNDEKGLFNQFSKRKKAWNEGAGTYDSKVVLPKIIAQFHLDNISKVTNGEWSSDEYNSNLEYAVNNSDSIRNLDDIEYQSTFRKEADRLLLGEQLKAIGSEAEFIKGDNLNSTMAVLDTELQSHMFKANGKISMSDLLDPQKKIGARLQVAEMSQAEQNEYYKQWSQHIRPIAQEKVEKLVELGMYTKTEAQLKVYNYFKALAYRTNNVGILDYIQEAGKDGFKPSTIQQIQQDAISARYHIVANTDRANANAERESRRQSVNNTNDKIFSLRDNLYEALDELESVQPTIADVGIEGYEAGEKIEQRISSLLLEFDNLADDQNVDKRALGSVLNLVREARKTSKADPLRSESLTNNLINEATLMINAVPEGEIADLELFHEKVNQLAGAGAITRTDQIRLIDFYTNHGVLAGSDLNGYEPQEVGADYARNNLLTKFTKLLKGTQGAYQSYLSVRNTPTVQALEDKYITDVQEHVNENGVGWVKSREYKELFQEFTIGMDKAIRDEFSKAQQVPPDQKQLSEKFGMKTEGKPSVALDKYLQVKDKINQGDPNPKAIGAVINLMFDEITDEGKRKEVLSDLGIKDPTQQEKYLLEHALAYDTLDRMLGEDLQIEMFGKTLPFSSNMVKENFKENSDYLADTVKETGTTLLETFKELYDTKIEFDANTINQDLNKVFDPLRTASTTSNQVVTQMFNPLNRKLEGLSAYLDTLDDKAIDMVRNVINKRHDLISNIDKGTQESRDLLKAVTVGQTKSIVDNASTAFQEYASDPNNVAFDREFYRTGGINDAIDKEFNRMIYLNAEELTKELDIGINRVPLWVLQATLLNPNLDKNSDSYKAIEKEIKRRGEN